MCRDNLVKTLEIYNDFPEFVKKDLKVFKIKLEERLLVKQVLNVLQNYNKTQHLR